MVSSPLLIVSSLLLRVRTDTSKLRNECWDWVNIYYIVFAFCVVLKAQETRINKLFLQIFRVFSQISDWIILLGILPNFWSKLEFWMNLTNTAWERETTPRNEFLTKPRKPENPSNRTHEMFVKCLQNSPFDQRMISKTLKIWFCNTQVASAATVGQLNS